MKNNSNFNYVDKKYIANQINKINNKQNYKKLFKIVKKKYKNYTINNNGIFINLNDVNDDLLSDINIFLKDIESEILSPDLISVDINSNIASSLEYNSSDNSIEFDIPEIKLNDDEKNILRRNY